MTSESYLVIGGEGFLGHALVTALIHAYPTSTVTSLDLVQRHFPTPSTPLKHTFVSADLTSQPSLIKAIESCSATTVFHTASPWIGAGQETCELVNVEGTRGVVRACQKTGVTKLVYTSSSGVVFVGDDLIGVDERLEPPLGETNFLDYYNVTKAEAEAIVLEANGKDGVLTCALRPAGIFGPGDRQAIPGFINVLKNRQTKIQLGSNENLFDWTYIDNVVHAHLLASEKLHTVVTPDAFTFRRPAVSKTLPRRPIPTSLNRGDELPDEKTPVIANGNSTDHPELTDVPLPTKRTRFDAFSPLFFGNEGTPQSLPVAGQAFFITGGEPLFFWDFARAVWHAYDDTAPTTTSKWVIPKAIGLVLGGLAEGWGKVRGKESLFTRNKVSYACATRWYNIEKARVMLGYEPVVGVEEGIKRGIEWYKSDERAKAAAKDL